MQSVNEITMYVNAPVEGSAEVSASANGGGTNCGDLCSECELDDTSIQPDMLLVVSSESNPQQMTSAPHGFGKCQLTA